MEAQEPTLMRRYKLVESRWRELDVLAHLVAAPYLDRSTTIPAPVICPRQSNATGRKQSTRNRRRRFPPRYLERGESDRLVAADRDEVSIETRITLGAFVSYGRDYPRVMGR